MLQQDYPFISATMRNTWTERLVQDGNKAAGQRERHDIMLEQGNKERLPAIVLPSCSGLGSVSHRLPVAHRPHTHKLPLATVKLKLRQPNSKISFQLHIITCKQNVEHNTTKQGLRFYYRVKIMIKLNLNWIYCCAIGSLLSACNGIFN